MAVAGLVTVACTGGRVVGPVPPFACQRDADCSADFRCRTGECRPESELLEPFELPDAGAPMRGALSADLVAYWPFDGDAGDRLGGHHGDPARAIVDAGKIGQAYDFAGRGYVYVRDVEGLSFAGGSRDLPFSWSMWLYPRTLSASAWLAGKRDNQGQNEYQLVTQQGGDVVMVLFDAGRRGAYLSVEGLAPLPLNRWSHVVVTYDGSRLGAGIAIYVDGAAVPTSHQVVGAYSGMVASAQPLVLSTQPWQPGNEGLNGLMDEVGVWRRALRADEVAALYAEGNGLTLPESP